MQTFKKIRFWLVWILAVFSGQWSLILKKYSLIQISLYQKYIVR